MLFCAAALMQACSAGHETALHGMAYVPPQRAANFALTDQYGRRFELSQARGQVVVLYFGFAHCRDVCPQTLARISKARARAGLHTAQVRIVMISVDPERDTPRVLRRFLAKMHVRATALTGSLAALRRVEHAYGIEVQKRGGDLLHTDLVFVIDRDGRIVEALSPASPLKDVAADLRNVVE